MVLSPWTVSGKCINSTSDAVAEQSQERTSVSSPTRKRGLCDLKFKLGSLLWAGLESRSRFNSEEKTTVFCSRRFGPAGTFDWVNGRRYFKHRRDMSESTWGVLNTGCHTFPRFTTTTLGATTARQPGRRRWETQSISKRNPTSCRTKGHADLRDW